MSHRPPVSWLSKTKLHFTVSANINEFVGDRRPPLSMFVSRFRGLSVLLFSDCIYWFNTVHYGSEAMLKFFIAQKCINYEPMSSVRLFTLLGYRM